MDVILDSQAIEHALDKLAEGIAKDTAEGQDIAVVGVRSRGEVISQRLGQRLGRLLGKEVPVGTLDITLYRDDLNNPQSNAQPQVRTTEIGFDIDGKIIYLVDDVLHTGRSTRAAMDALIDLGRPQAIRLAVLVDRRGREFPIQADYAGKLVEVSEGETVQVRVVEVDGVDEVIVE